jgi:glycogen debranching enzyme
MKQYAELIQQATAVLQKNDRGTYTVPAEPLYPHQWLWDSAFIAIGLRHVDAERAKTELLGVLRGQWANGMIPHVIHSGKHKARDGKIWRSWLNPYAPEHVSTSGITQPPIMAEAVLRVAEKLKKHEQKSWLRLVYPNLVRYHEWLYHDRDPHDEGLVLQVHPWETGLDNTPPWMQELHDHQLPLWIQAVRSMRLSWLFNNFRNDTKIIPTEQRMSTIDALALYSVQRRLRRKNYDIRRILAHSLFAIEDVSYNAIFIRNNQLLCEIATELNETLPAELLANMKLTEAAFEKLWDPYSEHFYSREFVSHRLIKEPSIGTLIALYAGTAKKDVVEKVVRLLEQEQQFGTNYPVPSMPVHSSWFKPQGYWQGPTWINTNWLIIDGLKRHGYEDHAATLRDSTLEMIAQHGFSEYFSPLDGSPAGAQNFSWTAALAIDLAHQKY